MFWCYLFAFVSTIINDPNSPIKSAAVLVPMTAFGIVLSLLDFVSTDFFKWLNYIPFTYLFTQSASIILTEIDKISFIISTSITSSVTLIVRVFAIKYVKFETIQWRISFKISCFYLLQHWGVVTLKLIIKKQVVLWAIRAMKVKIHRMPKKSHAPAEYRTSYI